jgi:hypothetical protein
MSGRHIPIFLILLLTAAIVGPGAWAQQPGQPLYSREQLAQMLAPIALYPDPLLTQILMASTYPLEVVQADRWLNQRKGLKGQALDQALRAEPWDASLKSLCHFPTVLAEMDKNLDRTTALGNAFLAQQAEVMDVVQELRGKAEAAGNLASCPEYTVQNDGGAIAIEPAQPGVVYVPYYDPGAAYGPWGYPAYPPYPWFSGYYPTTGVIVFSLGFYVGPAVANWALWNWTARALFVNWALTESFLGAAAAANAARFATGYVAWSHDPGHRLGVAYPNPATAQRFGRPFGPGAGPAARGFPAPGAAPFRPGAGPGVAGRPAVTPGVPRTVTPGLSPFTGLSSHGGGFENRAGQRGGAYPGLAPSFHAPAPAFHGGGFAAPAPAPAPAPRGGFAPPAPHGGGPGGFHR